MSLPPEKVSIKRKRDAESVDVLFVQDSKRAKTQFVFKRVQASGHASNPFAKHQQGTADPTKRLSSQVTSSRPQTPKETNRSILKPRRFHLERPSLQDGAITKIGSPRLASNKKLAVLVENSVKKQGTLADALDVSRGRPVLQSLPPSPKKSLLDAPKQQQLRPRASAAELRWREERWGPGGSASRSVSRGPTPTSFDAGELKLAHELDAFAREQESRHVATQSPAKVDQESPRKKPLKFQPKASAAGRRLQVDTKMDTSDSDESDYEYDTYERVPYVESAGAVSNGNPSVGMEINLPTNDPSLEGKSIGILIIGDEDEDLWATYQELDDSDDDYDVDDEDENAEDYYGNDYPEDELDSEDEFGHGAYGYRYAGSDDEQYGDGIGDDDGGISDDEPSLSRHEGGQSNGSWRNEFASPVQNHGLHPY